MSESVLSAYRDLDRLDLIGEWSGAIAGLAANAAVLTVVFGGGARGLMGGLLALIPGLLLAVLVHNAHTPFQTVWLNRLALALTVLVVHLVALTVRTLGLAGFSLTAVSVLILALVALLFTPGPVLGVIAVQRWLDD